MSKKTTIGIVGVGGYTARELLRILVNHSGVTVSYLASESFSGNTVAQVHPKLKNVIDLEIKAYNAKQIAQSCDLVFLAKPHPSSFKFAKELFKEGVRLIDLSAAFRFKDKSVFESWYGIEHESPELLSQSVYGLPELYCEEIREANLVANPGCYPTGIILGLAPLINHKMVETDGIIVNSISGFSGAGRSKQNEKNLAANVVDNIKPYNVTKHPHTPEIEKELAKCSGACENSNSGGGRSSGKRQQVGSLSKKGGSEEKLKITFVPHVAGFERGIINTIYLKLRDGVGFTNQESASADLFQKCSEFYLEKPFVRVYAAEEKPEIKNVLYTNFCDIGIEFNRRTGTVILATVLDNLLKGASGQAIQNMNIMLGFDESLGLQ